MRRRRSHAMSLPARAAAPATALVAALVAGLAAGCAPAPGLSTVPDDPFAAERAAVAARGAVPAAAQLLPTVELVGYPRRIFGEVHRDTIRGAESVERWLGDLRLRSGAVAEPFRLRATSIQICEGAAVEEGRYALAMEAAPDQLGRRGGDRRYLALWRPAQGEWKLERLWLDPERGVRMATVATGCERAMRAERDARRVRVGAGGRAGGGAGLDGIAALMEEDGWPAPAIHNRNAVGVEVWASYRISRAISVRSTYERIGKTRLHGYRDVPDGFRSLNVDVDGHLVALLGEWRWGPVWLAAGPGMVWLRAQHEDRTTTTRATTAAGGTVLERRAGGLVELGVRATRLPTIVPVLSLAYDRFPELDPGVGGYPAPVPMGGWVVSLGLELPL